MRPACGERSRAEDRLRQWPGHESVSLESSGGRQLLFNIMMLLGVAIMRIGVVVYAVMGIHVGHAMTAGVILVIVASLYIGQTRRD